MNRFAVGVFLVKYPTTPGDGNRILVAQRVPQAETYPNLIQTPSGFVDSAETTRDAIMRVLIQDVGLVLTDIGGYLQIMQPYYGTYLGEPQSTYYCWAPIWHTSVDKPMARLPYLFTGPWQWDLITDLLLIQDQLVPSLGPMLTPLQAAIAAGPEQVPL